MNNLICFMMTVLYTLAGLAIFHDMEVEGEIEEEERVMTFVFLLLLWPLAVLFSIGVSIYCLIMDWKDGEL